MVNQKLIELKKSHQDSRSKNEIMVLLDAAESDLKKLGEQRAMMIGNVADTNVRNNVKKIIMDVTNRPDKSIQKRTAKVCQAGKINGTSTI